MPLKINTKFEGTMTSASKNYFRNLSNFHQSIIVIQSRKHISLKLTVELCVMIMKNDAKFERNLSCRFKTDMRNFTNYYRSTQKLQNFTL